MNILEIIKKAPEDHVYYCPINGDCYVEIINRVDYPIVTEDLNADCKVFLTEEGKFYTDSELPGGECILFPSRDNRDWEAFERELDGVFSDYCEMGDMTAINLDHEYYKNHPYIDFQIDGKEYKVSIEDIKRLVPSDVKDVKERFRIVEKGDDKYSFDIEDREKNVSGKSFFDNTFDGTPKIVLDDNTKKIIKMAEKWQREIEKIEKHWKEVEPMMRYMAQRVNEMYKEYQRRNNHDKKTD